MLNNQHAGLVKAQVAQIRILGSEVELLLLVNTVFGHQKRPTHISDLVFKFL